LKELEHGSFINMSKKGLVLDPLEGGKRRPQAFCGRSIRKIGGM